MALEIIQSTSHWQWRMRITPILFLLAEHIALLAFCLMGRISMLLRLQRNRLLQQVLSVFAHLDKRDFLIPNTLTPPPFAKGHPVQSKYRVLFEDPSTDFK